MAMWEVALQNPAFGLFGNVVYAETDHQAADIVRAQAVIAKGGKHAEWLATSIAKMPE